MDIDIKTIALFYLIANAMNNGLIYMIWRMYRKHFRGISFLFADMCLQTLGALFLLLRGALPDIVSIILTNLFSVSGLISRPYARPCLRASASRKFSAPKVTEY